MLLGLIALAVIGGLFAGALAALVAAAPATARPPWSDPYLLRVAAFTLWQAGLSTVLAVGLAVPVARAIARRGAFPGRTMILRLYGLPLVIPVIVAVFGVVTVYGHNGWINTALAALGLPRIGVLYGLPGILIAHVFFNLPLATRFLVTALAAVPGETWRLAAQLGMPSGALFRLIEWPMIRQVLPGVAGLVFMLCFTSFAVVLTLGGGPRATIIEVAIYQALRLDFDVGRAVALALVQIALCGVFVGIGQRFAVAPPSAPSEARSVARPDRDAPGAAFRDGALIAAATLYVTLPLAAVVVAGLAGPLGSVLADGDLWRAAARSLAVALSAGTAALALGWCLLTLIRELRMRRRRMHWAGTVELAGSLVLVVSPQVLGAGLFLLLIPVIDVLGAGLVFVVAINAVMGLPYTLRLLGPTLMRMAEHHDRLCASLRITGWNRFRLVDWPALRRPAGLAGALTAALAMGDLSAVALFGTRENATLPLLLYQRLGGYRLDEAAVTALVLVGLALLLFVAVERVVGGRGEG